MDFRVVVSDPKSGKAYQVELKDPGAGKFLGKHIGDKIEGDVLGMPGYSVQVTGGSDREGFPMRADLPGTKRSKFCYRREPAIILSPKARRRGRAFTAGRYPPI